MWERVGDRTELQHIDPPTLLAISVSFPFSYAAQPGAWGPASQGHVLIPASSLQLVWSPTATTQSGAWGPSLLGAGFLYSISSPTGLVSKLTDFLFSPSYIIVQRVPSCGRLNRTNSTHPRSRLYSDILWADAPVIYISYFDCPAGSLVNIQHGQIVRQTELFNLGIATSPGEENNLLNTD